MIILFLILIILCSVILGLIVLIQNPKGGGLAGSIAGLSNQFMGVKQTTDVLEKGTWVFAAIIGVLCICSAFFIKGSAATGDSGAADKTRNAPVPASSVPLTPPAGTPGNTINLNDSLK